MEQRQTCSAFQAKHADLWDSEAKAGRLRLWGPVKDDNSALLAAKLAEMEANKNWVKVTLSINSEGGNTPDMWALTDALVSSRMEVTAIIDGWAYSAALVIAVAADVRKARAHAEFLWHGPRFFSGWDKSRDQKEYAAWAERHDAQCSAFMAQRTNKPKTFWQKAVTDSRELRFGAEEALEWGVVHEIIKP